MDGRMYQNNSANGHRGPPSYADSIPRSYQDDRNNIRHIPPSYSDSIPQSYDMNFSENQRYEHHQPTAAAAAAPEVTQGYTVICPPLPGPSWCWRCLYLIPSHLPCICMSDSDHSSLCEGCLHSYPIHPAETCPNADLIFTPHNRARCASVPWGGIILSKTPKVGKVVYGQFDTDTEVVEISFLSILRFCRSKSTHPSLRYFFPSRVNAEGIHPDAFCKKA
eukprot:sb/3469796/